LQEEYITLLIDKYCANKTKKIALLNNYFLTFLFNFIQQKFMLSTVQGQTMHLYTTFSQYSITLEDIVYKVFIYAPILFLCQQHFFCTLNSISLYIRCQEAGGFQDKITLIFSLYWHDMPTSTRVVTAMGDRIKILVLVSISGFT
jgi:hypothetical protein